MQGFPTKDDRKIEQHRGHLGVVLFRKKEGFQGLCSGSVVNLVQSKHFPSCKERKVVKCLLTSNDVFLGGDPSRIGNYVIDYGNLDLKSGQRLKLSDVAQSKDFFQPTPGLTLIPVLPTKAASLLWNLKSSVFDDRRTFHTSYYCNEDGESETRNQIRCFIAGSPDSRTDSFKEESFTLISTKDEQGQLRYELQGDDRSILKTYDEIRARNLYPRGAPIVLKFKPEREGKEAQVTCVYVHVGTLNFSNDDNKISPVFLTQETLTGQVQLYFPTSGQASAGAKSIGCAQGGTAVPKKGKSCKLGQGEDHESRLARNALAYGYRIREVDIPSDGNCLFHAVEDQLNVLGVPGHTHESLRNLAVQELRSNMDDNHLSLDLAEVVENNDALEYIQKMSVDGAWGGHPELLALSHALQKTIRVVSSTSEAGNAIQDIGSFDDLPILLGFQHDHYRSLEQVKKDVGQDTLTAGPKKSPSASLPRNVRSVVTGRSSYPPPHNLADIPGEESGRPCQNYDVTTSTNDYSWPQKEEYLKNINFLTTLLREKTDAELHKVQRQPEEDPQEVKRLKEQISEENEGLRIDHSVVCTENRALRTENSALRSKVNSQNICAVCGNDSQSSTESTAAKLSSPRRSDSSGSSEEEYVDALSEPGGFTLE